MTEHAEQVAIFEWAKLRESIYPELELFYAIPNGAKLPYRRNKYGRYSPEALRLLAEGLKPGIPDMCLPVPRGGYCGLYIELKHGRNKPTPAQVRIRELLTQQGYLAVVIWEAENAISLLENYLSGNVRKGGA